MKDFRFHIIICILVGILKVSGQVETFRSRGMSIEPSENWARELQLSDEQLRHTNIQSLSQKEPRLLKSKKPKAQKISKNNKHSKQSNKLKDEVNQLRKKLKAYKRKLETEKKSKSKHSKKIDVESVKENAGINTQKEDSTNNVGIEHKKIFRGLVLKNLLGQDDNKIGLNSQLETPSTRQTQSLGSSVENSANPVYNLPDANSLKIDFREQAKPDQFIQPQAMNLSSNNSPNMNNSEIQGLIVKSLTLKDFDKIAQRKLTVEKYNDLMKSLSGLTAQEKKTRYLQDILTQIPTLISDILEKITGALSTTSTKLASSAASSTVGGLALGAALGFKARKNKNFMRFKTKILKEIDLYNNMNSVVDDEKINVAKIIDSVAQLTSRTKSITANLQFRFSKKIEMFSISPF